MISNIVFTNGCFDLLHAGHVGTLRYARDLTGGRLGSVVVGLNSDVSIRKIKGNDRPIISQWMRRDMLLALKYVDRVMIFDEETPYDLIKKLNPDIIVKGPEYLNKDVVGSDIARIEIVPKSYCVDISTSKTIEKIRKL